MNRPWNTRPDVRYLRLLLVVLATAAALVPLPPQAVERWYSHGLYPRLQPAVTMTSSLVPLALLDVAAGMLVLGAVFALARGWRRFGLAATGRRALSLLLVTAAAVYLWFVIVWGLNYRRVPLEQKLAYDASRVSRAHAKQFGALAVEQVNALKPGAGRTATDDEAVSYAFAGVERALGGAKHALLAPPKRSLLTWYFRKAAIDGMTNPFFLEIILNPELLPFERPFVLAHEWAHLGGYADESEANFIAWLTCITGPPSARYSGWLSAYDHVARELPREDRLALRAALSPAVAADLMAVNERLARSSPAVRTAARGAYDTYLRANRIEEGIANYNAVVRLMLGTSFGSGWEPQTRKSVP